MFDEYITPFLQSERGRHIGMGVLILFSVLFCYSLITTLVTWKSDYTLSHSQLAVRPANNNLDEAMQLIADIPNQHLFGLAASSENDFLPITSLQVRLKGIIKTTDDTQSRAIISQADKAGKIYRIGDELISGITINSINTDNVILEHNGRLEKLPLARPPLLFQDMPTPLWQNGQ